MVTKADAKQSSLQTAAASSLYNLADLEWNFYSANSGLTPASKFSITDHKLAYYKLQGGFTGSIRDVESAFFKSQGAVGNSWDEIAYDFYLNHGFFSPKSLSGLSLWLEADNLLADVIDNFDRGLVGSLGISTSGHTWNVLTAGATYGTSATNRAVHNSGGQAIAVIDTGASDGTLQVTIPNLNDNGFVVRASDDANNYVWANNGTPGLYKKVNGVYTLVISAPIGSSNDVLKAVMSGDTITVYRNGTLIGSVTDSFNNTATQHGLRSNTAGGDSWDDFSFIPSYRVPRLDGTPVALWPDLSGNGRHMKQATAANRPLFRSSNPNKLTFDAATFEISATAWGNSPAGDATPTFTQVVTGSVSGSKALQVGISAIGTGGRLNVGNVNTLVAIQANTVYTVSGYISSPTASRQAKIGMDWYNSSSVWLSRSMGSVSALSGSPTQYVFSATAPSNAAFVAVDFEISPTAGSLAVTDQYNIDNAGVFLGSVMPASGWVPPVTLPNNKPCVQFDGVDDVLVAATNFLPVPFSIFAVSIINSTNRQQTSFATSNNATGAHLQPRGSAISQFELLYATILDITSSGAPQPDSTTWHHLGGIDDGSLGTLYVDGVNRASSASRPPAPSSFPAVGTGIAGSTINGSVVAVVALTRAITTTERQNLENYFRNKYALP